MTWAELHAALVRFGLVVPAGAAEVVNAATAVARGIAYDSRVVKPDDVFVALKGQHADGSSFVHQASERGALAVVSEQARPAGVDVDWTMVVDARRALAVLAAEFYDHPSREMQVVGITGTNGKTTTAYLLASIFDAAGIPCGVLGTVAYRIGPTDTDAREAARTTPEAPEVQALLREMVNRGSGACVMEVSSHALTLHRVDEVQFSAGVFTNLTRDHLDFHADMDEYFRAKRRLFEMLPSEAPALLNVDDPRGASLAETGGRPVTYAINRPADITTGPLSSSLAGLIFDVRTPRGALHIRSSLVGRPNVYNILAAVATGTALGLPFDAIERGIARLDGVPGRFQVVSGPSDEVTVVVDYAHTDDALRNLLETARPLTAGRLITVFGCGGDRDRTKRPLMGAVAGRLSDAIVITSDNPRSEDPNRIIDEIQLGITSDTPRPSTDATQVVLAIVDRRAAIAKAIELARPGDLVLVAGKGHERYQVIGARTLPFDDVEVAREALQRRRTIRAWCDAGRGLLSEIPLEVSWIAGAMAGTIVAGERDRRFTGVSIDTRTIAAGELFIAIRGERFDGTDFAETAIDAGAAGVVVPRGRGRDMGVTAADQGVVVIEVDDTTTALQALGSTVRRESGTRVVAITGSAGKTTTKEAAAEFLAAKYRVIRNRGNLNNHIGLPLSLVDLRRRPDIAVVELGMNHAGEIRALVRIAEPEVRVWTNAGDAHVGFFASLDAIADAKAEILDRASPDTLLVANADDERVTARIGSFVGRRVTFGIDRPADVRATGIVDRGVDGISAHVETTRGSVDITTPLVGRSNLANVLAATAVAIECGVPLAAIAEKAATLRAASHRGDVIRLANRVVVIDDSYNANPTATRRALDVLAVVAATRRIAVLGEMLELGARAVDLHAEVGRAAAAARLDMLFAIGGASAAALAGAAVAAGMEPERVRHFPTSDEAAAAVVDLVAPGDVVLVKGSRGVKTDRVVDRLRAETA